MSTLSMKKPKTWKFTAPLERLAGRFAWHFVEFPYDVKELFGKRGEVRVKTVINGIAVDRALMPTKSGYHILILGGDLRRKAQAKKVGDPVTVELWLHPDPDHVDVPEELAESLDFMPEMKEKWDQFTPGMQRSLCYWVSSARTTPTKAKRVAELLNRLETGYYDKYLRPGKRSAAIGKS